MIDTHAHLTDLKFAPDLDEVIVRTRNAGVVKLINPSINLGDAKRVVELTQKYDEVYGLAGIYPGEADPKKWREEVAELRELLLRNTKMVGIGEIGLDIATYSQNPMHEEKVFVAQLMLARELDYPVVIHNRGTEIIMWEILTKIESLPRGHFHCFGGSVEWLEYVLARGFYVGFDANITYKNADDLRALAKKVPLERLLLETDSPYLPPQGKRGERNEPTNVTITAAFLAKLRGESLETLSSATTKNAIKLYGI